MHSVTDRRTDGQTDGQQAAGNSRSYCVTVRSAKKLLCPLLIKSICYMANYFESYYRKTNEWFLEKAEVTRSLLRAVKKGGNCLSVDIHALRTNNYRSSQPSIPPGYRVAACMAWVTRVRRGAFTCVGWQVTLCDPV